MRQRFLWIIAKILFFLKFVKCNNCEGAGVCNGRGEGDGVAILCFNCGASGRARSGDFKWGFENLSIGLFFEREKKFSIEKVFIPLIGCIHSKLTCGGVSYIEWFEKGTAPELSKSYCPFSYFDGEKMFSCSFKSKATNRNFTLCEKFKVNEERINCWKLFIEEHSKKFKLDFDYLLPNLEK